jgi:UDP-glucose 4-epimerase
MSVLVTGGAGFMGSHLADFMLKEDYDVFVLDNLTGGFERNVPEEATLIVGDCTNEHLVDALCRENRFKYIFHMAAYAAEGLSHFIRRYNYQQNLIASINLINAAIKYGVSRFVFTSSMGVYGEQQLPYTEDMIPAPEDPYGIAKYAVEQDLRTAHEVFGLEYTIFRPHNVYGTRQNIWDPYRNVIGIFMAQIMRNEPMTIFGDGTQMRAFSHISDVSPIIGRSVNSPRAVGQIYNVGGEEPITINELSIKVADAMGTPCTCVHLPARYEVHKAYSDHKKLRRDFKWLPLMKMNAGLPDMAKWAAENFHKTVPRTFWSMEQTRNLPHKWK